MCWIEDVFSLADGVGKRDILAAHNPISEEGCGNCFEDNNAEPPEAVDITDVSIELN